MNHYLRALVLLLLPLPVLADPNAGLVARYSFESLTDGRVSDLSGRGNDLLARGELSLAPGRVGQALSIGGRGYAQAPCSPSLELGGEMTLEAWIRPEANPPSGMRLLDRATIGGNDGFMFDTWPEGHLRLIIAPSLLRDTEQLPVGQWTHVAATYSAELCEVRLYRNGEVVAETAAGGKLRPSTWPLNLGASQGGGDRFSGLMDEVRIYNRALAPEEIRAHYQGREIEPPASALPLLPPQPAFIRGDRPLVDYAAQCARNDLVYLSPAKYPFEAMRLGNGNLGVTTWNAAGPAAPGMSWQLNNGRYRLAGEPVSSGRLTLQSPALGNEPKQFTQRLHLWEGTVTTRWDQATLTSFVAEGEDCLVCRYAGPAGQPLELRLHLWPSRTKAKLLQGSDYVALVEQPETDDPLLPTAMATVVRVDGAAVEVGQSEGRTLLLKLRPGVNGCTIYAANPVGRMGDRVASGLQVIARLQQQGYAAALAKRQAYFHSFWPRSFVHFTSRNGEAELLENLWYLYLFDMANQSRHTLCPKFNGGNYLVHEDLRHWGGGYWHQNTREIVWPLYAMNHLELTEPFFNLYRAAMRNARENGRAGLGVDGFYIPEWVPVNGGKPLSQRKDMSKGGGYTAFIYTVGLELALQAWWRYEFGCGERSGDEQFLRETAYPLLKGSLDFYLAYAKKGPDGRYHLDPADAQESYWLVRDPAQDLAALRWAIPAALQVSQRLRVDAELRPRWQELLDNLAPFAVDPEKHMLREADLKPTDERHNSENVADYAIYPFAVFGLGKPDYELARSTFENRPVPGMGNGWEPAAIVAARLGLSDEAAKLTLAHMLSNLRTVAGGWYSPTTAVFAGNVPDSPYYDAPGVSNQGLCEMLLQSHDGLIRLAPAWPARWQAQCRLLARGGFVVSLDIDGGKVRYALVESTRGGACRVANPWKAKALVTCGGAAVLASEQAELRFATVKGKTYRLEPAAAPLAMLPCAKLAPTAAVGPKWIGRLAKYPQWSSPAYLGLDAEGRTPQRAMMLRNVRDFAERLAKATPGLAELSRGAAATVTQAQAAPQPAPGLTDGLCAAWTCIPHEQHAVVDLGQSRTVSAVVFSRDRSGLFVDQPCVGYSVEVSGDGQQWAMVADHLKSGAPPAGEVATFTPVTARHVRLKLRGQYNGAVAIDEVTVYGPGETP